MSISDISIDAIGVSGQRLAYVGIAWLLLLQDSWGDVVLECCRSRARASFAASLGFRGQGTTALQAEKVQTV